MVKISPANNNKKKKIHLPVQKTLDTWVQYLDEGDPLEKGMQTHSRILAWRMPCTEEPVGLHSMGHRESDMTEAT